MRLTRAFRRLFGDRKGTAAIEFAFTAPILLGGLVVMADIGLAISERMNLDQAVRVGAEFAMSDVTDQDSLKELVKAAASGNSGEDPNDVQTSSRPEVTIDQTCKCPGSAAVVTCTDLCTGNALPSVYYDFTASKTYNAIFLPDFDLSTKIQVQIR